MDVNYITYLIESPMRDALSSNFLLLENRADRSRSSPKGRASRTAGSSDRQLRMALMEPLTQALQATMGADLLTAKSASRLAEAMSDIALGRSVAILTVAILINPKLAEARRGAATLFLEKVVRVGEKLNPPVSKPRSRNWRT